MKFMIFVIDSVSNSGTGDEIVAIDSFNQKLVKGGHLVMAAGIASPDMGLLVDNREDQGVSNSGSLNGADFYSGFWIIDVPNSDQAEGITQEASKACNRRVELRPFL